MTEQRRGVRGELGGAADWMLELWGLDGALEMASDVLQRGGGLQRGAFFLMRSGAAPGNSWARSEQSGGGAEKT